MKRRNIILATIATLAVIGGVIVASGKTIQVTAGQSIQAAINQASAGDTVAVQAGTYTERLSIPKSVTVICETAQRCIIKGADVSGGATLDGFYSLNSTNYEGAIIVTGSNNIVRNNKIENACMVGAYLKGSNNLAENNDVFGSRQCPVAGHTGFDADGFRVEGVENVFRGNYIHDIYYNSINTTAHIDCFQGWIGSSNTVLENNVCDVQTRNAILANSGVNIEKDTGMIIKNNYFRVSGKYVMVETTSKDTVIENNIFVGRDDPQGFPYQYGLFGSGSGETARGNIFYHVITSNPLMGVSDGGGNLFVDPKLNGYCSTAYPLIGVPCGSIPPTATQTKTVTVTTSRTPTNTATVTATKTATATATSTYTPTPTLTASPTLTPEPTTISICNGQLSQVNLRVHIVYPSNQTLRMRSAPALGDNIRAAIFPDPGIEWFVIEICHDVLDNYWGELGEEMWFALKYGGVYFSDWRE